MAEDKVNQFKLRSRRDRIIGLLGMGTPLPIRDLPVSHNDKVPFNSSLEVRIDHSQEQVQYTLYDANRIPLDPPLDSFSGIQGTLRFFTPPIKQDVTFTVLAERINQQGKTGASNFLHYAISLRVGIDVSVIAFIAVPPSPENKLFPNRIWIDYNTFLEVQVGNQNPVEGFSHQAQEEVRYSLVSRFYKSLIGNEAREETVISVDIEDDDRFEIEKEGKRDEPLVFRTRNFNESAEIEVKLVEIASPSVFDFLDRRLQVFVRPNPDRTAAPHSSYLLPGETLTVSLNDVHASENYKLYGRTLNRQEFGPDGSLILPESEDPGQYVLQSNAFSMLKRLREGITQSLHDSALSSEDRTFLEKASQVLDVVNPDFEGNFLREVLNILEASFQRVPWPNSIQWIENPVELTLLNDTALQEDSVFYVQASKWNANFKKDPSSTLYLEPGFTIHVLNPSIQVTILKDGVASGTATHIDYRQALSFQLGLPPSEETEANWRSARTQKGVSYVAFALINGVETEISTRATGTGRELVLELIESSLFVEDIEVKIKAFPTEIPEKTIILDSSIQVWVRPNPSLTINVEEKIVPYAAETNLSVEGVQSSTNYELWGRELDLTEYKPDGSLEINHKEIDGLLQIGPTQSGADAIDGSLSFASGVLEEDRIYIVKAIKQDAQNGESLLLDQFHVILTLPDPKPSLSLNSESISAGESALIRVANTQSGVKYQLRVKDSKPDLRIKLPGYHIAERGLGGVQHKSRLEFGMRMHVDFKIGNKDAKVENLYSGTDLDLPTQALDSTTSFEVIAIKAYTGLEAVLNQSIEVVVNNPSS